MNERAQHSPAHVLPIILFGGLVSFILVQGLDIAEQDPSERSIVQPLHQDKTDKLSLE